MTLQSPNNKWLIQKDAFLYKVPETPKGAAEKKTGSGALVSRITPINGSVVFVRYSGKAFRKMLQTDRPKPFNYIDLDESQAVPYHVYVLNNKKNFLKDNPKLVEWAEGIQSGNKNALAANPPEPTIKSSFDGDSNFTSNTNLDLSFNGNSILDFDGARMLDNDIVSKFSGGKYKRMKSNFSGGAMPDFNGGDTFAFTSNTNLDLSFNAESNVCGDGYAISNTDIDLGIDGSSKPTDIKAFQSWYNKNKGGKLLTDGKWGKNTIAAWNASKNDYAKIKSNITPTSLPDYLLVKPSPVTSTEAEKLADANKVVYTEEEAKKLYEASGSKQKFSDWVKSDNAKTLLGSISQFGQNWLINKSKQNAPSAPVDNSGDVYGGGGSTTDKKIHPLTIGLIILGASAIIIGGVILYNKHKAKISLQGAGA